MNKALAEVFGWYGSIAILLAYTLATLGTLATDNIIYLLLNITGAAGLAYISFFDKSLQPALLNLVWCSIALWGIYQYFS